MSSCYHKNAYLYSDFGALDTWNAIHFVYDVQLCRCSEWRVFHVAMFKDVFCIINETV
jgi:hypothetical protein